MFEALVGRQLDAHVAVVGAGPAGSATAALLARAGLDVMLLDRDAFPRDKVCGDFVSPTALVELEWLGIGSRPEFHAANAISSASLHIDGERLVEQGLPETPGLPSMGRVVPRAVLDEWIVDAARTAGARVMEKAAVKGIEIDERGVELELAGRPSRVVRAGLVVGADGSNSLVARQLRGHGPDRADRIVAVRAYYDCVEGDDHEAALYFSERTFPGYTWLFPTGAGTANVGVGMMLATIPAGDHHLRDLLEDVVRSDHALGPRLRSATRVGRILGWPLTTYNPRLPLVGDRMLLVGDAAGLINPLNGEGIQYALASARWAAETIAACAAGPRRFDTDGLLPYAQRVEEQLGTDMTLARAIVQLISNRALNPFWLLALRAIAARASRDPNYAATAGGILVGTERAQRAGAPDFLTATVVETIGLILRGIVQPDQRFRSLVQLGRAGIDVAAASAAAPREMAGWGAESAARLGELAMLGSL
ncbi:MAG TPA: geranylgeranyl reductase family protein [Gaiellaceae bacterium]